MQETNNKISTEEFHKEIDLIQACIIRMAQNSFLIKGWAFGIVTALVALTAEKMSLWIVSIIGCFILLFFWYFDAFFLAQEKLYRFKYEWVIDERPKGNRAFLYDLNPYNQSMWKPVIKPKDKENEQRKKLSVVSVMFSRPGTLLLFYGSTMFVGVVVILLSAFGVL
jgi:hypothetical protein